MNELLNYQVSMHQGGDVNKLWPRLYSLGGRRSKGKGEGIRARDHAPKTPCHAGYRLYHEEGLLTLATVYMKKKN